MLRAVLVSPEDDAPRMVYADWLDENGQEVRAEFIRVQIKLAALPKWVNDLSAEDIYGLAPLSGDSPSRIAFERREALERRQQELWLPGAYGAHSHPIGPGVTAVLSPIFPGRLPSDRVAVYRRGFVDLIECPLAAFLGGPCRSCDGGFVWDVYDSDRNPPGRREVHCSICKGVGRVPGLATSLFTTHPITEVHLAGREPLHHGDEWSWWDIDPDTRFPESVDSHPQSNLPRALFTRLPKAPTRDGDHKRYPSPGDAHAALSLACVSYGRFFAGLHVNPNLE